MIFHGFVKLPEGNKNAKKQLGLRGHRLSTIRLVQEFTSINTKCPSTTSRFGQEFVVNQEGYLIIEEISGTCRNRQEAYLIVETHGFVGTLVHQN